MALAPTSASVLAALLARRPLNAAQYSFAVETLDWRALTPTASQAMANACVRAAAQRCGAEAAAALAAPLVARAQRLRWPPRDADAALQLAAAGAPWTDIADSDNETAADIVAQVGKSASLWLAVAALL